MTDRFSDRYLRAMLRGATRDRLIDGWQGPHTDARSYTVAPSIGDAGEWPLARTIAFVTSLEHGGVLPMYRPSEP